MNKAPLLDIQQLLHTDLVFEQSEDSEEVFHQNDLIQLEAFGISLVPNSDRPFLLMRDSTGHYTLPVFLNPLEAGVTLTQSNKSIAPVTPHSFAVELLKSLNIRVVQSVFVQIKGSHQYMRVYMQGHPSISSLKLRADEVMSFVLQLEAPIYATKAFINKSKLLNAHIEGLTGNISPRHKVLRKNQPYIQ